MFTGNERSPCSSLPTAGGCPTLYETIRHRSVVGALLTAGARVEIESHDGRTALHRAATWKRLGPLDQASCKRQASEKTIHERALTRANPCRNWVCENRAVTNAKKKRNRRSSGSWASMWSRPPLDRSVVTPIHAHSVGSITCSFSPGKLAFLGR